jgi:hypothetical protein
MTPSQHPGTKRSIRDVSVMVSGVTLEGLGFTGSDVRRSFELAARTLPVDMLYFDNAGDPARAVAYDPFPTRCVPCSVRELGPHRRDLQRKALRAPCEKKFELSHFRRAIGIRHRAHADQTIA